MNKKGIMRIIEATIAILIVLGALLVFNINTRKASEEDLTGILPSILDEMARNSTLRFKILVTYDITKDMSYATNAGVIRDIEKFLDSRIKNSALNYTAAICNMSVQNMACGLPNYPAGANGDLFVAERVMSTEINQLRFEPKRVKIYLWRIR